MKIKNKIILCVCSFILMICTMFSFVSITKSDNLVVKADSVVSDYYYEGSNFYSKVDFPVESSNLVSFSDYSTTLNGVNCSVDNSVITVNGTLNSFTSFSVPFDSISLDAGIYYLSFDFILNNSSISSLMMSISYLNSSNQSKYFMFSVTDLTQPYHYSFELTTDSVLTTFDFGVYGTSGTYDNFQILDVMLTQDSSYPPYQPSASVSARNLSFKFDFLAKRGDYDYESTFVDIQPTISDDNNYWLSHSNNTLYNTNNFTFDTNAYGSTSFPMNFVLHNKVSGSDNYITDFDVNFKIYTLINKVPASTTGYFDSNVSRIVFGSYLNSAGRYSQSDLSIKGVTKYNFIAFYNSNGLSLDFVIPLTSSIASDYFDYRTYYISDNYDENGVYMNGYKQGYNTAKEEYTAVGYDNGYKFGYNTGYNNGFSDGTEDSNQYTFLNLISATIDAPITYFQELFNFELLGVNLQGFLTGLFTLCVIVTIIKLCLGG